MSLFLCMAFFMTSSFKVIAGPPGRADTSIPAPTARSACPTHYMHTVYGISAGHALHVR